MWPKFLQTPVDLYQSNKKKEESTILRCANLFFSDTLTVIFTAREGTSHIQGVLNILYDENSRQVHLTSTGCPKKREN